MAFMRRMSRFSARGRQRGIFDLSFGSEEQETSGTRREEGTRTRTTESRAERETQQTGTEQQETVTRALPVEVQELLTRLITGGQAGEGGEAEPGMADVQTSGDIAELSREMAERARLGEAEISEAITQIVAQRDRQGRQDIQRLMTRAAQQAGGSFGNTLVSAAGAEGIAELQSQLAATEGELRLAGRRLTTEEFAQAIGGLAAAPSTAGAESNAMVQLVDALRGATTVQTGTRTSEQRAQDLLSSTERLTEIIDMLVTSQSTTERDTTGFGFSI